MRGAGSYRARGALCAVALIVSFFGADVVGAGAARPSAPQVSLDRDATDQIIVRLRDGSTPNALSLTRAAGEPVRLKRAMRQGAWVTRLDGRRSVADARRIAARIAAMPGVAYAEPDRWVHPTLVPTDPSWSSQWDMSTPTASTFGADLPPAWDITRGTSDVVVAVIDTGITVHADLAGQTLPGYDFISDLHVANDGNLRDNDPHDPGDWIDSTDTATNFFAGCSVSNSSWHGTHVSGTIAAVADNGIGVTGIAPGVKILPVRVLGKCGGFDSDIADGMRWAAGLAVAGVPANPNPAGVLNLSLGGTGPCSITDQQAITDVTAVGATVVVAAGNSNADASAFSPANCAGVVAVAATGKAGSRASYSNFGTMVDIAAPGGDGSPVGGGILSTWNTGTKAPVADAYAWAEGTSMAAPHVSGVAALVKSVDPALTPAALTAMLQANVTAFPAGSTCTVSTCGAGLLDAGNAVAAGAAAYGPRVLGAFSKSAPAPGTTGQARSGTLQWTASAGATGYEVCIVVGLTAPCTTWVAKGNVLSTPLAGLAGNTLYSWQVRATNGATSAEANISLRSTFTTAASVAPAAPSGMGGTAGDASVALSWTAPTDNGGTPITDYVVQFSADNGGSWTTFSHGMSSATNAALTFLANGTGYVFHVAAVNAVGPGPFSATSATITPTSVTPIQVVPGAPTSVAVTPDNGSVGLTWSAPADDGGSPIGDYVVQFSSDNGSVWSTFADAVSPASFATVTGLTNGMPYVFRVAAVNGVGTGAFSVAASVATPRTTPSMPAAAKATASSTVVSLAWVAPGNGGAPVLDYAVEYSPDNGIHWTLFADGVRTATTAKVVGLTNGHRYLFRVAATNVAGTGAYSPATAAVPATRPNQVAPPTVTSAGGRVTLRWPAPANGGAAIADYVVQYSSNNGLNWIIYSDGVRPTVGVTITGLRRGLTYRYRVAAVNVMGRGAFSGASGPNKLL